MLVRASAPPAASREVSEGTIDPARANCEARLRAWRRESWGGMGRIVTGDAKFVMGFVVQVFNLHVQVENLHYNLIARSARNIGISLRARFSAAARGPLVLFL